MTNTHPTAHLVLTPRQEFDGLRATMRRRPLTVREARRMLDLIRTGAAGSTL